MGIIKGHRRRWRNPEEPLAWGETKVPHFEKKKRPKMLSWNDKLGSRTDLSRNCGLLPQHQPNGYKSTN